MAKKVTISIPDMLHEKLEKWRESFNLSKMFQDACSSKGAWPQIASRCAVFAKTDLIHAQQEGYQIGQISNGLCRGLAHNIVSTPFSPPANSPREKLFFAAAWPKTRPSPDISRN